MAAFVSNMSHIKETWGFAKACLQLRALSRDRKIEKNKRRQKLSQKWRLKSVRQLTKTVCVTEATKTRPNMSQKQRWWWRYFWHHWVTGNCSCLPLLNDGCYLGIFFSFVNTEFNSYSVKYSHRLLHEIWKYYYIYSYHYLFPVFV